MFGSKFLYLFVFRARINVLIGFDGLRLEAGLARRHFLAILRISNICEAYRIKLFMFETF